MTHINAGTVKIKLTKHNFIRAAINHIDVIFFISINAAICWIASFYSLELRHV